MKRIIALMFGVAACAAANAGFTTIGSSGETNTLQILSHITGASLTGANWGGLTYSGGGFTVNRIDDFGFPGTLDLGTGTLGSNDDQTWRDGTVTVAAQARFAGYSQYFGWNPGATAGNYVNLFGVGGNYFNVTGGGTFSLSSTLFAFARNGGNGPHYSLDSLNADGRDHMLTYEILSLGGPKRWVLMFEDLNVGDANPDWDYNDLVVELVVIPAPAAAMLGILGLGIAGWVKRRMA